MKTRVFDSWPIIEWIYGRDPSRHEVRKLLDEAEASETLLLMSAINVGEVYYFLYKNGHRELAQQWRNLSLTLPVRIDTPSLDDIWIAALLKAKHPIAYADSFAAALAQKHGCPIVTGDPDFRAIDDLEIEWIGH